MFVTVTLSLLEGFLGTIKLFGLTLLLSLPLGLILSFGSMEKLLVIKYPIRFLIWVIRGTPLMLQLLVIYYGPGIFFGVNIWGGSPNGSRSRTPSRGGTCGTPAGIKGHPATAGSSAGNQLLRAVSVCH